MNSPEIFYQKQSVLNSNPIKLVVKMYDLIAQSCYKEDKEKVKKLLSELIHHLNFDYPLSVSLFEVYRYCQDLARESKFDEIIEVLNPLRESWDLASQIENKKKISK